MKFSRYNLVLFEKGTDKPILFNTFTGNTFFLSYEALDSIKKNDISSLDCRSRELFSRAGVIIEDTVDELRYFSYFNNRNKYFSEVLSSTIILTWSCNFSCVYCYEGAGEKNETMDHEHALQYIKFMKNEAKSRGSMKDYVQGGTLTEVTDLILLSLYEPRHGYAIIQFVEEVTNGRVLLGAGTLYGALSSLEQKGWIKLQSTESTSRKKVYLITPSGKEAVQTEIDRLHQLIDLAERISKEI